MPASEHWQVLDGVRATVAAIVGNTFLRKRLAAKETDTFPLCVVAPGRGGERMAPPIKQAFGGVVVWQYPVLVGYIRPNNGALLLDQAFIDLRAQVRDALFSFGAVGVASVFDFDLETDAPDSAWNWTDDNFDAFVFEAFFSSSEQRTS